MKEKPDITAKEEKGAIRKSPVRKVFGRIKKDGFIFEMTKEGLTIRKKFHRRASARLISLANLIDTSENQLVLFQSWKPKILAKS